VRNGGRGAQLIKRPNTPFLFSGIGTSGNPISKGYYSADFFCGTFSANASDKGKKVIKDYAKTVFP